MKNVFSSNFGKTSEWLKKNKNEITKNNRITLRMFLNACCLLFALLLTVHLFLSSGKRLIFLDCLMFFMTAALQYVFCFSSMQRSPVCGFYLAAGMLFVFAVHSGLPQKNAVLAGLYSLFPSILIDKSWRMNTVITASCLYCILLEKSFSTPVIHTICFAVIGALIGEYMRYFRINSMESIRQAQLKMKIDFLTGLLNRRKLYERIKEESTTNSQTIHAVMMLDIDYFKRYNDCYGHQAGDLCLQKIGVLLKELEKEDQIEAFRYGGEEFLLLIYTANISKLNRLTETLRKKIRELGISFPPYEKNHLTLSIGFAVRDDGATETLEQLINHADKALYCAKSNGRNKVCRYSAPLEFSAQRQKNL